MNLLDEVSQSTLDPTLGDPRFGPVLVAMEAVGPECKQHQEAKTTANTIRTAMAARKNAPTVVVENPPPPPPPPASTPAEQAAQRQAVAEYLRRSDALVGGANVNGLMQRAFAKKGDFSEVLAEFARRQSEHAKLSVPEGCRDYHDAAARAFDEAQSAVGDFHRAIQNEDKEALQQLAQRGAEAKAEAAKMDAELNELRKACAG